MGQTYAKPVRKRRRWLLVAFVLVLVSGVAWWNWPRGDARFVGKWAVAAESTSPAIWRLELKSNGVGRWRGLRQQLRGTTWVDGPKFARWSASGEVFTIGNSTGQRESAALEMIIDLLDQYAGIGIATEAGLDCRIISIEAGLICLERRHDGTRFVLRRIAE